MLLTKKKSSGASKNSTSKIGVGSYGSTVVDVCFHPDYVDESAILVKYKLIDSNGQQFEYEETFINNDNNTRTKKFFDYLETNGITVENIQAFVGCNEKISIKKMPRNGKVFNTIAERAFVN